MENSIKRDYLKLKILNFVRYFADAFFYCFFQVYLAYRGLTESKIGIVASILPIAAIIVNPIWNSICKNVNINKLIITITTVVEGIIIIIIGNLSTFETIMVATIMLAIVYSPFYSLLDSFCGSFTNTYGGDYGIIRMYGSLAYVFATSLAGILIGILGYKIVFIIAGSIFILCSLLIKNIKPITLNIKDDDNSKKRNFKAVFTNKKFYLYLIFYLLTVSISLVGDTFLSVFFKTERGCSEAQYGFIYSGIVLTEVVIMILIAKIGKKIPFSFLLILAGICYSIRQFAIALDLPLYAVILLVMVRGFAWGSILSINIRILVKIVGINNLTTAVVIIAVSESAFKAIGNTILGNAIENIGYYKSYGILGIINLSVTILALIYFVIKKISKKEGKNNEIS
ncbi:MAG: MFS transporter [Anaeroplasmataceae bacterium]